MLHRPTRRLGLAVLVNVAVGLSALVGLGNPFDVRADESPRSTVAAPASGETFGDAVDLGSMKGRPLAHPVVDIAATPTGKGYWLVARDGGIFSFGDATFFGSTGAIRLNQPIVGITPTPTGKGYWFVASDGGVFSFGDAAFLGSTGAIRLNQPIVGMASTPTGKGYWLVASDGGIFSFGDARFLGGTGGMRLNQPISGMASTSSGNGYWLAAQDGAVFAFGDARPLGTGTGRTGQPVVGIARAASDDGYWLGTSGGSVFSFGAATAFGVAAGSAPVVGIAATPTGLGYWLAAADGGVISSVTENVAGSYSYLRVGRDDQPVRYDPCRDVHYVINPALAPAGVVDEVHTAFRRIAAATGIRFVYDGTTTESHVRFGKREAYQPQRYGDRWAPLLVSWSTEVVEPLLAGGTLGYGGSTSYWAGDSDEAFVTGEVVFDIEQHVLRAGFGTGLTRGNLILHELGHLVGLDHVHDRSQLMYSAIHSGSADGFAAGDLAGLAKLGAGSGCLDVATPR